MQTAASTTPAPAATGSTELHPLAIPRIGAYWPEQGGHFAGIVAGADGAPDTLLIIGPEAPEKLDWNAARDWASKLGVGTHRDFSLPTRSEQAVAYGNCKGLFKPDWYWSCEQSAGTEGYAWFQIFYGGLQTSHRKNFQLLARAVRRVAI